MGWSPVSRKCFESRGKGRAKRGSDAPSRTIVARAWPDRGRSADRQRARCGRARHSRARHRSDPSRAAPGPGRSLERALVPDRSAGPTISSCLGASSTSSVSSPPRHQPLLREHGRAAFRPPLGLSVLTAWPWNCGITCRAMQLVIAPRRLGVRPSCASKRGAKSAVRLLHQAIDLFGAHIRVCRRRPTRSC